MMTLDQVREVARQLPAVTEEPHFDYTSFRVRGKIFATAKPDGEFLHVFVGEQEREEMLAREPDFLAELRWGRSVAGLRVLLPSAKPKLVQTLLEMAWSRKAPKRLLTLMKDQEKEAFRAIAAVRFGRTRNTAALKISGAQLPGYDVVRPR